MAAKGKSSYTLVEILSLEGRHVAEASCTYEVRSDPRTGIGHCQGRLSRVQPEGALEVGSEYRLRLPGGGEGTITIQKPPPAAPLSSTLTFKGMGSPPPPPSAAGQA